MPPKAATKKQATKCLKFGEILIDENRKLLLLCVQCFSDFADFHDLNVHLKTCDSVCHLFKSQSAKLKFDNGEKLLTKVIKDAKELHIYGIANTTKEEESSKENGNISDFLDIEEELLNPRWFTDTPTNERCETSCKNIQKEKASYNDLIMEVTPFVQFKENVKTIASSHRVTRESAKQSAAKEKQEKSIAMQMKKNKEPLTPPRRFYLSEDKKQVLRATLEECPKKNASDSKTKPETNTNSVPKKPLARNAAKNGKEKLMTSPTEKEKVTTSLPEKAPLKRKLTSFPVVNVPYEDVVDTHNMVKRRRTTAARNMEATTSTNAATASSIKPNETKTIQTSPPAKKAQNPLPVLLKTQKTIIVGNRKENNTVVSTTEAIQNKNQNALPSSRQSLPQTQRQPQPQPQPQAQVRQQAQVKVTANPNRLVPPLTSATKQASNHQSLLYNAKSKIQTAESQQTTTTKFVQHIPAATSTPISKQQVSRYPSSTVQQKPTESSNQKTVEILNKLQTLGLKVQRTNPPTPEQCQKRAPAANEQALEIIKKLQSKGMNVKIVQKSNTTGSPMSGSATEPIPFTVVHKPPPLYGMPGGSTGNLPNDLPSFSSTDANTVRASNSNFSKNIFIKKCT